MNYRNILFLISVVFIFNSCSDNEDCCAMPPEPEAEFDSGILVLNEGNFGSGNASVSFINSEDSDNQSEIYKNTNGTSLGDTAQSIEMHEDLAVIVVNVSSKLEIVNRYTFESLGTIRNNLLNPRYAEIIGNKLYVTNWGDGANPDDDFVAVFDLNDYSFLESIPVAEGPEKIISSANSLFVAHKGGFSFNNKISVINAESYLVEKEIEVGDVPNSMVLNGSDLWVLSAGKPSYAETETAGSFSKIDIATSEVSESYTFSDPSIHPENLKFSSNIAYFTVNKSVYKYMPGEELPAAAEFQLDQVSVLYGVEVRENKIYVASPNSDFTGNGKLYVYDLNDGSLLDQYTTGVNPNGIYFNDLN